MNLTYGDNAKIKSNADEKYKPGELVSICMIDKIDTLAASLSFKRKINTVIYTVEYCDGSSIAVPEDLIEETDET